MVPVFPSSFYLEVLPLLPPLFVIYAAGPQHCPSPVCNTDLELLFPPPSVLTRPRAAAVRGTIRPALGLRSHCCDHFGFTSYTKK